MQDLIFDMVLFKRKRGKEVFRERGEILQVFMLIQLWRKNTEWIRIIRPPKSRPTGLDGDVVLSGTTKMAAGSLFEHFRRTETSQETISRF